MKLYFSELKNLPRVKTIKTEAIKTGVKLFTLGSVRSFLAVLSMIFV